METENYIHRVMSASQMKDKLRSLYYYERYLVSIKREVFDFTLTIEDNNVRQSRVDSIADLVKSEIRVYEHLLKEAGETLPVI